MFAHLTANRPTESTFSAYSKLLRNNGSSYNTNSKYSAQAQAEQQSQQTK